MERFKTVAGAAGVAFAVYLAATLAFAAETVSAQKEYLARMKTGFRASEVRAHLSSAGVQVTSEISQLGILVLSVPADFRADSINLPEMGLEYIEPNSELQLMEPAYGNDTRMQNASFWRKEKQPYDDEAGGLWGMKAIQAPAAWDITKGSKEVIVAVSDTGIWTAHRELKPNLWVNMGETGTDKNGKDKTKNKIDDDGNGFIDDVHGYNFYSKTGSATDDHYHGTHVAGTIGAAGGDKSGYAGVAWNVRLMALKFLNDKGSGSNENGIRTILYAADQGAKVLNASWGGDGYSQAMADALKYASEKGMIIVAAAGNSSLDNDTEPHFPSSYEAENLIAVASVSSNGKKSGFSNWGKTSVDLAAPGENIASTFNPLYKGMSSHNQYYSLSGTSMAAPHVSGALALLYSKYPSMTWRAAKDAILSSSVKSKNWEGKTLTGGILDVNAALKMAGFMVGD